MTFPPEKPKNLRLTASEILAQARADAKKTAKDAMVEANKKPKTNHDIEGQWVHCKISRGKGVGGAQWAYLSAAEWLAKPREEQSRYSIQRDGRAGNYYQLKSRPGAHNAITRTRVNRTIK